MRSPVPPNGAPYLIWWLVPDEIEAICAATERHLADNTVPAGTNPWPIPTYIGAALMTARGRDTRGSVWTNHLDPTVRQVHLTNAPLDQVLRKRYIGILIKAEDSDFAKYRGILTDIAGTMRPFKA